MPDGAAGGGRAGPERALSLAAWLTDGRAIEVARRRSRQASLERQAAEMSSLSGVLLDLAEWHHPVVVTIVDGRRLPGVIEAVGRDFFTLVSDEGARVLVMLRAMATVSRTDADRPCPMGFRAEDLAVTMADLLTELAAERPELTLELGGARGIRLTGTLERAGLDMLTVRPVDARGSTLTVPLAAVDTIEVTRR